MSYQHVVVGYDGSDNADRAVAAAAEQAGSDGVVHVVSAYEPESGARLVQHMNEIPEEFRYSYDPEADEHAMQQRALVALAADGVDARPHLVPGDPATAIIEVAEREGAGLVVVGSRGRGRVQRFLRGSVSTRVATHAPMNVLIVH